MSEHNDVLKNLVHRWFEEVWNKGRSEVIDEMIGQECIIQGVIVDGSPVKGPVEFKGFYALFRATFPDVTIEVLDTIAEGDKVAARCRVRATHKGSDLGIAASNNQVDFTGMCIAQFKDGIIVAAWNNFDFLSMYQQIGAMQNLAEEPRLAHQL